MHIYISVIFACMFFFGAQKGFCGDSQPDVLLDQVSVSKSVPTAADSKKLTEFLNSHGNSGLLPALAKAEKEYGVAIQQLANKMAFCSSKDLDHAWLERVERKFGIAKLREVKKDLKLAIGAKFYSYKISCEKEDLKAALYAESNLLPLLFELGDSLKEFVKTASSDDLKYGNVAESYIDTVRNAKPTPLQLLVNPAIELKTISSAAMARKDVTDFVDADPTFKGGFNLDSALKSIKF